MNDSASVPSSAGASGGEHRRELAVGVAPDAHDGMDQHVDAGRRGALSSIVAESTRNGMSSVTISTTVCGDCQPCCSNSGL